MGDKTPQYEYGSMTIAGLRARLTDVLFDTLYKPKEPAPVKAAEPVAAEAPVVDASAAICNKIKADAKAMVGGNASLFRVEVTLGEANHGVSCSKPGQGNTGRTT
ncbi:MAG: hypothetical protein V4735_00555 [Pseudomonadota bacterium]